MKVCVGVMVKECVMGLGYGGCEKVWVRERGRVCDG